jgi:N-acetylglutamate synthase-like GNAT family acetyltransferase
MTEVQIRPATPDDKVNITRCVNVAYAVYAGRVGHRPAQMLADYAALIEQGTVYVVDGNRRIDAVLVIHPQDDHLFVENVAVRPSIQGKSIGKQLLQFAENQARQQHLPEIRLSTLETMVGNLTFFPHLGFAETERINEDGHVHVWFSKQPQPLAD